MPHLFMKILYSHLKSHYSTFLQANPEMLSEFYLHAINPKYVWFGQILAVVYKYKIFSAINSLADKFYCPIR